MQRSSLLNMELKALYSEDPSLRTEAQAVSISVKQSTDYEMHTLKSGDCFWHALIA